MYSNTIHAITKGHKKMKVTFNMSEADHQSLKLIAMIEKTSMSKILSREIKRLAKKINADKLISSFPGTQAAEAMTEKAQNEIISTFQGCQLSRIAINSK